VARRPYAELADSARRAEGEASRLLGRRRCAAEHAERAMGPVLRLQPTAWSARPPDRVGPWRRPRRGRARRWPTASPSSS